jgi:siroheme synthase-like protein
MESINQLYPVFFRLDRLKVLIVGAGMVGEEKLTFMLKSSPNAQITVIAPRIGKGVQQLLKNQSHKPKVILRKVQESDIQCHDLIISATNYSNINLKVYRWSKKNRKIVNVADTPDLCDFYMGSIVTRGDLKVAISTNGKSPTFSKRFRQFLEEIIPEETPQLIQNLKSIRDQIKGNFSEKVKKLNHLTQSLINE